MRTTLALFIGSAAVATGYVAPAAFAPFGTVAKVCHATEPRSIWPSRSLERLVGDVGRHSSASLDTRRVVAKDERDASGEERRDAIDDTAGARRPTAGRFDAACS